MKRSYSRMSQAVGNGSSSPGRDWVRVSDDDNCSLYFKDVKDRLGVDETEKLNKFYQVFHDWEARRIDTVGTIARIKEILRGHPELILGFNFFLPAGYKIRPEEEDPPQGQKPDG